MGSTTANPATVSRILGRDHARSRTVRGRLANNTTEGFTAQRWCDGTVRVTWTPDSRAWDNDDDTRRAQALAAYTQTLTAAGYTVHTADDHLAVTKTAPAAETQDKLELTDQPIECGECGTRFATVAESTSHSHMTTQEPYVADDHTTHYTAWLTNVASCLDQPNIDLTVLQDKLTGADPTQDGDWSTDPDRPQALYAVTSVPAEDGDIDDAIKEAENLLVASGWTTIGAWDVCDSSYFITVERA